jgi:hypothetical protein
MSGKWENPIDRMNEIAVRVFNNSFCHGGSFNIGFGILYNLLVLVINTVCLG